MAQVQQNGLVTFEETTNSWSFPPECEQGLLFELSDAERDSRSGDEWLLSAIAYCDFRADYLTGRRLLSDVRNASAPGAATCAELQRILDGAKLPPKKPVQSVRHLPSLKQISQLKAVSR